VLRRVFEDGAYSNLTLGSALRRSRLPERDRQLATELAYGTLRRTIPIDWVLERHASRPLSRMTPAALALLRLGAYQILFTRIPDHASIGETVGLGGGRERGFVNAVLRAVAGSPPDWPDGDSDQYVSLRTGLSSWGVRELRRLVGDEAEPAAESLAHRAALTLRVNTCRTTAEAVSRRFEVAGVPHHAGRLHPDSLVVGAGSPAALPGFDEGWFTAQDEASSFVARALDAREGDRILDACAAPGGKAGHLACIVGERGSVVASDVSSARAGLVGKLAVRMGVSVGVLVQDARRPALRPEFDRVLVDAPCSGIGAARRRPELLWRPARDDLSRLARLQVAIVASVARLLRPGGRLVYSVCTFPRAETDAACDAILRRCPELAPDEIDGPDGPSTRVRLWPHRHGTDAMFVAAFTKTA
jgi:16S rRNA (cytosine967-C5)-methyltransferase